MESTPASRRFAPCASGQHQEFTLACDHAISPAVSVYSSARWFQGWVFKRLF
jgi:hypothetical protein